MTAKQESIEEVLVHHGVFIGPTMGISMLPMLKSGRDTIVVRPKEGRLQPLDVALYKREEKYVLHRVLKVTDTGYIIRGDNCYYDEIVPEHDVIGVLTEFFRKDKHYYCTDEEYLRYAKKRVKRYQSRRFFVLAKRKTVAAIKKPIKWILRWDKRKAKREE